jgi:Domain of unknown function (DUF4386)
MQDPGPAAGELVVRHGRLIPSLTTLHRKYRFTYNVSPSANGATMRTATLDRSIDEAPATAVVTTVAPAPTTTSVNKTAALIGLAFLTATLTFATGNALIRSSFSNPSAHNGLIAGVFFLGCCGLAVAANGVATRRVLTSHTPIRAQAYFALRVTECLTLVAVAAYFLTSHAQWNAYVLAVYAVSGAAGLVLSSALLASEIVPRNLSILGLIGYPVFLVGTVLAMFNFIDVTHGAGMLALVPGGLFELILPIWLFTKGFASRRIEG